MAVTFLTNEDQTIINEQISQLTEEIIGLEVYVTPQQFGAEGDGMTDDTAAFQMAVDSGFDVLIPSGHYRCSNIIVTKKCSIIGVNDVRLTVPDSVNIPSYDSYTEDTLVLKVDASDVRLKDIQFDGNYSYFAESTGYDINAKFSSYGVRVKEHSSNVTISDCKFNNFKDAGVQIAGDCVAVTVEHNIFFDEAWPASFNRGIQVLESGDGHIAHHVLRNNQIYNCGEHGIVVYTNNDCTRIADNYIVMCGVQRTNPDGTDRFTKGACIKSVGCSNLLIEGNHCENGAQGAIIAPCNASSGYTPTHGLIIANNRCIGYDADDSAGDGGIAIGDYSMDNRVCGNIIERVHIRKYQFNAAISAGNHAVVSDNVIFDCDNGIRAISGLIANNIITASIPITVKSGESIISGNKIQGVSDKDAIALYDPTNTVISGNTISTAKIGIIIRNSADNMHIYGNTFSNVPRNVVWQNVTPTNCKVDFEAVQTSS